MKRLMLMALILVSVAVSGLWAYNVMPPVTAAQAEDSGGSSG